MPGVKCKECMFWGRGESDVQGTCTFIVPPWIERRLQSIAPHERRQTNANEGCMLGQRYNHGDDGK